MWQWKPTRSIASLFATRTAASRRTARHGEAELRIVGAGGDVLVGVRFDARGHAHEHAGSRKTARDERLDAVELVDAVDDEPPHAELEREPQLELRLVVPVEHHPLGRKAGSVRDVRLTAGRDVEVEPLFADEASHRDAEERLGRIRDRAVAERGAVLAASAPQFVLVVHIERCAERLGEPGEIAPADGQAAVVVDHGGAGQQAQVDRGVPRTLPRHSSSGSSGSGSSGSGSSGSARVISSGAWTPRIASALARPSRQASASQSRACVSATSSLMTRQSR